MPGRRASGRAAPMVASCSDDDKKNFAGPTADVRDLNAIDVRELLRRIGWLQESLNRAAVGTITNADVGSILRQASNVLAELVRLDALDSLFRVQVLGGTFLERMTKCSETRYSALSKLGTMVVEVLGAWGKAEFNAKGWVTSEVHLGAVAPAQCGEWSQLLSWICAQLQDQQADGPANDNELTPPSTLAQLTSYIFGSDKPSFVNQTRTLIRNGDLPATVSGTNRNTRYRVKRADLDWFREVNCRAR